MSVFQYLTLRSEWEEICRSGRFDLPEDRLQGTIDNIKWFLDNGTRTNRFRSGFDDAMNIAQMIVEVK